MDLTVETINRLMKAGSDFSIVSDEAEQQYLAINGEIKKIKKDTPQRNHEFTTLDGLLAYLNSHNCTNDQGVIFVSDELIKTCLRYQQPGLHTACLPLTKSEEFLALQKLFAGMDQKSLWRLLLSKLDGCIDSELMMQISNIQISTKIDQDTKIERTGIGSASIGTVTRMTYTDPSGKGTRSSDVNTNWQWTGRIWEAYDHPYTIDLTLEVSAEVGSLPKFIFHPRRLDTVLKQAKLDLVKDLNAEVDTAKFPVYEGSY